MKCILCKNTKQVRKAEKKFNKRINLHGNDIWRANRPPCDKPF